MTKINLIYDYFINCDTHSYNLEEIEKILLYLDKLNHTKLDNVLDYILSLSNKDDTILTMHGMIFILFDNFPKEMSNYYKKKKIQKILENLKNE